MAARDVALVAENAKKRAFDAGEKRNGVVDGTVAHRGSGGDTDAIRIRTRDRQVVRGISGNAVPE
jgi:hypothetical protein